MYSNASKETCGLSLDVPSTVPTRLRSDGEGASLAGRAAEYEDGGEGKDEHGAKVLAELQS